MLSLGRTPLANALLSGEQLDRPEQTFPLDLAFCPTCSLVQITETVAPEKLFTDYLYFSSVSETMVEHCRRLVGEVVARFNLHPGMLAVEIASNDGYLLQFYQRRGIETLGIEPAVKIAAAARQRGIDTRCDFFGPELADRLLAEGRRADVLHAHNVLAHVADLNGVVAAAARLLEPRGVWIIEVPYVRDLIENVEFDTIYHEHLCYFSLTALCRLFQAHELAVFDVRHVPLHGGSLQLYVGHAAGPWAGKADSVSRMLADELRWGVADEETYRGFGQKVRRLGRALVDLLAELKAKGKRIAAYGASAKGSTLLNCFEIGSQFVDFVVDRSPAKQNRFTPGTHLPIYSPQQLLVAQPDYVLLLTWNFADEILAQQAEFRRRGGRFIIPIPQVRVV